jgi:hypothetical protein
LWLLCVLSSRIQHCADRRKSTDISDEHVASNFSIEEETNQATRVKAGGKKGKQLADISECTGHWAEVKTPNQFQVAK